MITKRIIDIKIEIDNLYRKMESYVDKETYYEQSVVVQGEIEKLKKELERLRFEERLKTKIALKK